MINSISKFFEKFMKPSSDENENNNEHRLQLTCAALLMEICCADQHFSNEEMTILRTILQDEFTLEKEELDELWKLAREEVSNATSLFQFTALINENYEREAKLQLLKYMWRIAYADKSIDRYEESTIRKLCELLYLSHSDFIQAKLAERPEQ